MTSTLRNGRQGVLCVPVSFAVVVLSIAVFDTSLAVGQAPAPTFNADVAPIVFENCASCHRPGEIGPMPLTSFEEVRSWAAAIRTAVDSRAMPPWGADRSIGTFANDPSLTPQQIETIVRWVDAGTPEGAPEDLPELPGFSEGWRMGSPDVVFTLTEPIDIPASDASVMRNVTIPTGFDRDVFVSEAEVRPGTLSVTHHANVYAESSDGSLRVAGYTPGGAIRTAYPPGVAKLIRGGTGLRLNMHYNPKGQAYEDSGTVIGLNLAQGPVRKIAYIEQSGTSDLDIAPGDPNHEAVGRPFVFEEDSHILSFMPRMNERGKDFEYSLVYPDGTSRVLLRIPEWNYGWVFNYVLEEPVAAPAGSRIETVAHWDNSAANRHNPDPSARVGFGPEIMNGYFEYTLDAQDLTLMAESR